jgi:hypothetical protein
MEYRLEELSKMGQTIIDKLDDHLASFNNHIREDAILAEQVKQMMEEKKSNAGLWAGIGGAASGIGAFLYALVTGK